VIADRDIAALVEQTGVENQLTGAVLLVDDEPFNLRVLRDLLEDRWRVLEAASGEEALEVAAREPLDVVVADQRMPGMSGVDLLAELRQRRPDIAGIVLTGFADMQALESAINRANAFRFLRKPWEPADVLQALEQASAVVAQRRTISRLVTLLARRGDELRASLQALEAQQQALLHLERVGTIGKLSSGIVHDLRNVMTGLRAAEYELARTEVAPGLRELLTIGLSHVDALLRTLQSLRDFSRGGSLELEAASVDPARVVAASISISRMDLLFKTRRVETTLEPALPALQADAQKLTQVLVNLIRNALQATPSGATVRVSARALDGSRVELAVEDDGPGVAPELRERLFQPFVSGKGDQGLGMGLYMARIIVERHGGRIGVTAGPSGGARFEVVLPVEGGGAPTGQPQQRGAGT
jgi:signal transduction histidine kinase